METTESKMLIFDRKIKEEKEYWIQELSREIGDSNLRLEWPRLKDYNDEKDSTSLNITGELYEKLKKVSGDGDFLLYTILMAALKVCIHKYTNSTVIVIGSPIRGDGKGGNVLPIVDEVKPEQSFRQFLMDVRQTLLDAYTRQQYPFDRLIRDFRMEHMKNRFPLFDIALALTDIHCELPQIENDITITFTKNQNTLSGNIEFNRNLFDIVGIEQFATHYKNILKEGLKDSNRLISNLQLLTDEERYQILVEWNDTSKAYSHDKCMHQLFESQVERNPEALAAVFSAGVSEQSEDEQLTYLELNSRANQLAHYLQTHGVGPDVSVGIFMERSMDMLVSILGIMKAGGAYLPLDPDYPHERLAYMLEDACVPVLLTQECMKTDLSHIMSNDSQVSEPEVVFVDTNCDAVSRESKENLETGVQPENLAYLLYTSGSTGRPKGVLTCHRGLCNVAEEHIRIFDVRPKSRVIQLASQSFDASVSEFAMSLCSGATLYLGPTESLLPGQPLVDQLQKHAITHITIPPSTLAVLPDEDLPALKTIAVAGDICSADLVKRWAQGRRFFNAYGVTEASICSLIALCEDGNKKPTIGRPIANTQIYILDHKSFPVPVGVPGELYIGGICLARSYLNLPELTRERFINNPLNGTVVKMPGMKNEFKPVDRLYKTGDLARYLPDGEVELLGRFDHQIKIRGYRIEPGEVEVVLKNHPDVQQAVVIEREDQPGDKRLVAYVRKIQNKGSSVATHEDLGKTRESKCRIQDTLREYLEHKLPHYLVPSAFVVLKSIPLSPNGKVDRKALPAPEAVQKADREGYISPRNTLEMQLLQIWEDLLNVQPVGVRDNFFELGGHSLLAVQLMARIEQRFGKKLLLSTIFEGATIEQLVVILHQQTEPQAWTPLVQIKKGGDNPPVFCIHPGGGTIHAYLELARLLDPELTVYGLQACGFEKGQEPVSGVEEMAANYVKALQSVQPEGPYLLVGWCLGARVSFEMALQLQSQGRQVPLLVFFDAYAPSTIPDELMEYDDAHKLMNLVSEDIPVTLEQLQALAPDEQLTLVIEQAKLVNVIPPDFDLEQGRRFLEDFKANGRIAHSPISNKYQGKIILFRAEEEKAFALQFTEDHALAWGEVVTEGTEVHFVPGNHNTLVRLPHVQVLAEKLNTYIKQAQATN